MGVYNNNNGVLTPIANETQFIAPVNEYVTKPELEAIVPNDTSAENKLVNSDEVDGKIDDIWKAQGELGAKNLLYYPFLNGTETRNGILWTDNNDGSLSFDGTITSGYTYSGYNLIRDNRFSQGKYILSMANPYPTAYLEARLIDNLGSMVKSYGKANPSNNGILQFAITSEDVQHISEDDYTIGIIAMIDSSVVSDITQHVSGTIYPMLRRSEDTDSTWQPYAPTNYELMQTDNALAKGLAKFGKRLWQGNFTSGSIEVAGAAKYSAFIFNLNGAYALGTNTSGGGSFGMASSYNIAQVGYRVTPQTSGDNIIFSIDSTSYGGMMNGAQRTITEIYGLF